MRAPTRTNNETRTEQGSNRGKFPHISHPPPRGERLECVPPWQKELVSRPCDLEEVFRPVAGRSQNHTKAEQKAAGVQFDPRCYVGVIGGAEGSAEIWAGRWPIDRPMERCDGLKRDQEVVSGHVAGDRREHEGKRGAAPTFYYASAGCIFFSYVAAPISTSTSDASEPLGRDGQKYDDTSERRKEERRRRIRGFRMTVLYSATTWLIPTQYGRTIPGSVRGTDCFSESWAVGGRQSHSRRCAGRAARVRRPQRPPTKRAASLKCDRMGHHPRKTNYRRTW